MPRTDPGPLLWPEEVAELLGCRPATVIYNASRARKARRDRARKPPRPFPLEYDHQVRQVPTTSGGTRFVRTPRWREADVLAYVQARREAGTLPEQAAS